MLTGEPNVSHRKATVLGLLALLVAVPNALEYYALHSQSVSPDASLWIVRVLMLYYLPVFLILGGTGWFFSDAGGFFPDCFAAYLVAIVFYGLLSALPLAFRRKPDNPRGCVR